MNELNVFAGLKDCPLFIMVVIATIVVQIIIMFVPGIRKVFAIFDCSDTSVCS